MRSFRWGYRILLAACLLVSGCSLLTPRPGDETGQGELVRIGTVGDKRHQIKGLSVRTTFPICDDQAYAAGFRNALVDRWDTNAMLDRLPKRFYLDVTPVDLRKFLTSSADVQCVQESIVAGEIDGDRVGKKLYSEFFQKLRAE